MTLVPDSGNKYLSKMYNDFWMFDQGLLERPRARQSARSDRASLPGGRRGDAVAATDTLMLAYRRMKLFDVSQIPVMQGEQVIGIVDESDLVMHLHTDPSRFQGSGRHRHGDRPRDHRARCADRAICCRSFSATTWRSSPSTATSSGVITRIDLLNYLRKQL